MRAESRIQDSGAAHSTQYIQATRGACYGFITVGRYVPDPGLFAGPFVFALGAAGMALVAGGIAGTAFVAAVGVSPEFELCPQPPSNKPKAARLRRTIFLMAGFRPLSP